MIHMEDPIHQTSVDYLHATLATQSNHKMIQLFEEADSDKCATVMPDMMDTMPSLTNTNTTSTASSMNHGIDVAKLVLAELALAISALQEELPKQTGYDIDL